MPNIIYLPDILPADVAAFEALLPGFDYALLRRGWPEHNPGDELRWIRVDRDGYIAFLQRTGRVKDTKTLLEFAQSLAP